MTLSIRHNFSLKLLSVLLAIIGWAYFRFASNPLISPSFNQQFTVPITTSNLPAGYIVRFDERSALVTIQPKRGEPPIKTDEIRAIVDLSNRTAGVYNVPVQLIAPNVVVQSLSPASVTLTVEKIDEKTFPVAMHYAGQASVVVSHFTVTPSTVTVRGPTDELSQIATVRVDMPLSTSRSSLDEMIRPIAASSAGEEIHDVQVVPNLVRVQAQFLPATSTH
jgi:YbbR domain-containing protein